MKVKTTKRALLISGLALLLCVSMLVGSTFAWFSDSVTSKNNIIKAGNLDVVMEYQTVDPETGKLTEWTEVKENTSLFSDDALWEPGHTEYVLLRVRNAGTLALKYALKAEVYEEKQGTNVYNQKFNLSDYLMYGIVTEDDVDAVTADREAAVAAAVTELSSSMDVSGALEDLGLGNGWGQLIGSVNTERALLPGENNVTGLIITMPTTVGNEANYLTGTEAPYIKFGVNLYATQQMHEEDSFGKDYDEDAKAQGGTITVDAPAAGEVGEYAVYGNTAGIAGDKLATFTIPSEAVEDVNAPIEISVTPTVLNENVTVKADQLANTYEVKVSNLKAGNTTPIKVQMQVGTGLTGVELYHKEQPIDCTYDPTTGYVKFETLSFSPYTVVFDAVAEEGPTTGGLPEANVVNSPEYENTDLAWGSYGAWSPTEGLDSQLEAAYTFSCVDTLEEAKASKYANWYCDFYVKLDKDLGKNEIFLGGNYGSFGWVGFHNGDLTLDANTEIPLLGSVTSNPWTYADVVNFVGTFICGVGDVDDALKGATFTVMLRLTNPENAKEFYNVSTINYTFE